MFAGERELYERFVRYDNEELLRILTVERVKYRPEALSAAELVLLHRGAATPPTLHPTPGPSPPSVGGRAGPLRPYRGIDLCGDVIIFAALYYVTFQTDFGAIAPDFWLLDCAIRLLFGFFITLFAIYVRHAWQTTKW